MTRFRLALLTLALVACEQRIPDFHGVRLGMTPREVRDRWGIVGEFEVTTDPSSDITMKFTPAAPTSVAVIGAQFEFHMGALVAVRADVAASDPASSGAEVVATRAQVLHRDHPSAAGVTHLDWLSRECPTHATEANRLAKGSSPPGK